MRCLMTSTSVSRETIPTMRSSARRRIEISASSTHASIASWCSDTKSACVEVIFARARSATYFTTVSNWHVEGDTILIGFFEKGM